MSINLPGSQITISSNQLKPNNLMIIGTKYLDLNSSSQFLYFCSQFWLRTQESHVYPRSHTGCQLIHPPPPASRSLWWDLSRSKPVLFIAFLFLCLPFGLCQNASDSGQLPCRKMWTKRSRCSLVASGWQSSFTREVVQDVKSHILIQSCWYRNPRALSRRATMLQPGLSYFVSHRHFYLWGWILKWNRTVLSLQVGSSNLLFPPVTATKRQTSPSWTVGKTRALLWDPCLLHNTTTLSETHCFPPFPVPPGVMIC